MPGSWRAARSGPGTPSARFDVAPLRRSAAYSMADVAAEAGYADQAHLAREVRSLTGATLTQLRA